MRRTGFVLAAILVAVPVLRAQDAGLVSTGTTDPVVVEVTLTPEPGITDEMLIEASVQAGYGAVLPEGNPEAMAIVYDLANQLLAEAQPAAQPGGDAFTITITDDQIQYGVAATGGEEVWNQPIRRSPSANPPGIGKIVSQIARALSMYDSDIRGIGGAVSPLAQSLNQIGVSRLNADAQALKMEDMKRVRVGATTQKAAQKQFDAAFISGQTDANRQLAKLTIQPEKGDKIEVMFNPREYTIIKAAPWKHHDIQGLDAPTLITWGTGLRFTLFLDDGTPIRAFINDPALIERYKKVVAGTTDRLKVSIIIKDRAGVEVLPAVETDGGAANPPALKKKGPTGPSAVNVKLA